MKSRDFGALFDLLSEQARSDFYADLRADAEKARGVRFVEDVLGYDPAAAAKLPPREAFVKVMTGGIAAGEKLAESVGAKGGLAPQIAGSKVVDVTTEGDTATLTVEYENGAPADRRAEVKLVREDGQWRLAEAP